MSPILSTKTLGLISPSLIGLGSRRPRLKRLMRASSSAKLSSEAWQVAFSARIERAKELCIGVGIRAELGEYKSCELCGDRWTISESSVMSMSLLAYDG